MTNYTDLIGLGRWSKTLSWSGSYVGTVSLKCYFTLYQGNFSLLYSISAYDVTRSYTAPSGWTTSSTSSSYKTDTQLMAQYNGFYFFKNGSNTRDIWLKVEIQPNGKS